MTAVPAPFDWWEMVPLECRQAVWDDAILHATIDLMNDPNSGRPRPMLKWIVPKLAELGTAASSQTVRRHIWRRLKMTFREFVTATILARAPEEIRRPGVLIEYVWLLLGYRWGRAFTRLVVLHLRCSPRFLRSTA